MRRRLFLIVKAIFLFAFTIFFFAFANVLENAYVCKKKNEYGLYKEQTDHP